MNLNLGCGTNYLKDFVNCDKNKNYKADKYFDMELPNWPFPKNSIVNVKARHCLEHLTLDGYLNAWKELYRICKNNAIIEIHAPHVMSCKFFDDPTHKIVITPGGIQLFSKKYNLECQKDGLSNSQLGLELDIDFELVDTHFYINNEVLKEIGKKDMSWTYNNFNNNQYIYGNLVDEIIIKVKCIK